MCSIGTRESPQLAGPHRPPHVLAALSPLRRSLPVPQQAPWPRSAQARPATRSAPSVSGAWKPAAAVQQRPLAVTGDLGFGAETSRVGKAPGFSRAPRLALTTSLTHLPQSGTVRRAEGVRCGGLGAFRGFLNPGAGPRSTVTSTVIVVNPFNFLRSHFRPCKIRLQLPRPSSSPQVSSGLAALFSPQAYGRARRLGAAAPIFHFHSS